MFRRRARFHVQDRSSIESGDARIEKADLVAKAAANLSPTERERLAAGDHEITERAANLPPEIFAKYLRKKLLAIKDAPADAPSKAERQRAASTFDMRRRHDGMWKLGGELDDERGALVNDIVRRHARSIAQASGSTANDRAAALVELITKQGWVPNDGWSSSTTCSASSGSTTNDSVAPGSMATRSGTNGAAGHGSAAAGPRAHGASSCGSSSCGSSSRGASSRGASSRGASSRGSAPGGSSAGFDKTGLGEAGLGRLGIGYIVDAKTLAERPHPGSVAQTWAGDDVNPNAIQRLACDADLYAILLNRFGNPDGAGLTRRSASREQRLQLRTLYDKCPIDGATPFGRCEIHHVNVFYEHGGTTELDNLLPVSVDWHHVNPSGSLSFGGAETHEVSEANDLDTQNECGPLVETLATRRTALQNDPTANTVDPT